MTNSVAENTEELAKCEEAIANALTYIDVEKYE